MGKTTAESPTAPPAIRLLLVALLPLIALLLYLDGQVYDSDLLDFRKAATGGGLSADLFPDRIAGLDRAGQARRFDKDNLYEYINGHAEYFIGAGFRVLAVGEYGAGDDGQPRVVVNLYDMGGALNAFGVLANEAGDQAPVDVATLGFRGSQGVNFIHGPYYVQVSLFDPGLEPIEAAREMAAALAEKVEAVELAFRFPNLGTVKSTRFVREYYRGMEFFNNVVERTFDRDGKEIPAFVISGSADEIRALEQSLTGFLTDDGIPFQSVERNGLRFVEVEDPYEGNWFFVALEGQLVGTYAPLEDGMVEAISNFARNTLSDSAGARSDLRQPTNR
jgi:hypothetical protein